MPSIYLFIKIKIMQIRQKISRKTIYFLLIICYNKINIFYLLLKSIVINILFVKE